MAGETDPRHRCGHDEHAGDAVRRRRRLPRQRAAGRSRSIIRSPAGSSMTRRRSGRRRSPARGRWWRRPAARSGSPASASPTSARRSSSGRGGPASALAPAIVWQDRRTADLCAALKAQGHEPALQAKTGLLLDPYFSASKIGWAMRQWPALREAGDDLCVGTVESWLVFKLTGGLHVTDATNASRTALMDIHNGRLGRWPDRPVRRAARRLARDRRLRGLVRDDRCGPARRRDPDHRHGRRPAGGGDRPGVPRGRATPRRPTAPAPSC